MGILRLLHFPLERIFICSGRDLKWMIFRKYIFFFDYDAHYTNLGMVDDTDVINQMLESFGKLA